MLKAPHDGKCFLWVVKTQVNKAIQAGVEFMWVRFTCILVSYSVVGTVRAILPFGPG